MEPISEAGMPGDSFVPVGILSRVSTAKQVERVSLDQQEAEGRSRAARLAEEIRLPVRVIEVYRDAGVSGDGQDREALSRALADIEAGRIRYLIAYDIDRLSREPAQSGRALRACVEVGARLLFCKMDLRYDASGDLDFGDEILFYLRATQAKKERKDISERTARGRIGNIEKNIQTQRSISPYGYHIWQHWEAKAGHCAPDQVGTYSIIDKEAAIIRQIFERVVGGDSFYSICHYLQDDLGLPSPTGAVSWYKGTISDIIHHSVYKGMARYGTRKHFLSKERDTSGRRKMLLKPTDPETWRYLTAPAIIPEELWEAANRAAQANRARLSGNPQTKRLLSSFLRCPECGGSMVGATNYSKTGPDGTRQKTLYYVCNRSATARYERAEGDTSHPCSYVRYVSGAQVEAYTAAALAHVAECPEVIESLVRQYVALRARQAGKENAAGRRDALREQIAQNKRRHRALESAIVMAIEDGADISHLRSQVRQIVQQQSSLEAQIAALPTAEKIADMLPDPKSAAAHVASLLRDIPRVLSCDSSTVQEKRRLLAMCVCRVVAMPLTAMLGKGRRAEWGVEVTLLPDIWMPVVGGGNIVVSGNPSGISRCARSIPSSLPSLRLVSIPAGVTCFIDADGTDPETERAA